jgi:hypothetical protein
VPTIWRQPDVVQRGLEDERRHFEWILEQLKRD